MKKIVFGSLLAAVVAAQTGCMSLTDNLVYGPNGLVYDRSNGYLDSELGQPIQVEGNESSLIGSQNLLVVPENVSENEVKFSDGIPRAHYFYPSSETDQVRLIDEGGELSIWVAGDQPDVWAALDDFWAINQISLHESVPTAGFLETAWIDPAVTKPGLTGAEVTNFFVFGFQEEESDIQDRLRIYLTKVAGGTKISIDHLRGSPAAATRWEQVPEGVVSAYQSDMTFTLTRYLSEQRISKEAKSLSALAKGDSISSFGRNGVGSPVLKNRANYQQTWAQLEPAVKKIGAEVLLADADLGKLCFRRDDLKGQAEASLALTLLSYLQDGTEVLDNPLDRVTRDDGPALCLTTEVSRSSTFIGVISSGGNLAPSNVADQVLWELKPYL